MPSAPRMNAMLPRLGELAAGDGRGGDHRADRQVDAAGRDDERHADRQHADDARLAQDVEHVVRGQERVGLEDRADDEQQGDDADERVLLQLRAATQAGQRAVRAAGPRRRVGGAHAISSRTGSESVGATAWRSSSSSVAGAPSTSATTSPSRMTSTRRAQADELGQLGRHDDDAEAGARPGR